MVAEAVKVIVRCRPMNSREKDLKSKVRQNSIFIYFKTLTHNLISWVSHKKSYLVCVELTNFRIFKQPIPIFFSKYKTETANRGQRQLLENK